MTPDKLTGYVFLVDRDTGLDHGPCTVLGAREILAQANNLAVDGGHRYADKDDWDDEVASVPAPKQTVPVPKPAELQTPPAAKKSVDNGGLS